ncbi:hypothetical protein [Bacillus licheniformis]|uniref:hypothetical protein n=1 Tax=Bacillus licheniformis TaxID=1402 RepID=UPI0012FBCA05|nr:hypothetical protein [Bacillus licheniformis]MED0689941.1 hypothetical protein [Bacillus licheniformis]MED0713601.1 hypothetical protein [Bacillus licheniformis]MED0789282.1 hypothetical protein [Bacillus licheniformis]TWM10469.1 hypothetical protein CHCC15091_0966 [Bacillus licheniformis]WIW99364.1 hypothetical protein QQ984_03530 [Bacillus licheniformis]
MTITNMLLAGILVALVGIMKEIKSASVNIKVTILRERNKNRISDPIREADEKEMWG